MTACSVPATVIDRIREIVGPGGYIDNSDDLAPYLEERRGRYFGAVPILVRPKTVNQVSNVVSVCAEAGTPIVPQGGNTGLMGGAVPHDTGSEILLSLTRLNCIRDIDPINNTITVEGGCVLSDVQSAAASVNRLFPLSLAAEGSCQIGGNLSTNAGGINVLRYGSARDLALGLEVVLPNGQVWDGLRRLRKDNTGYDLKQLFIGAEGTLGIITAAVLRLFPSPRETQTAFIAVQGIQEACDLLDQMQVRSNGMVDAFELISDTALDLVLTHMPQTANPLTNSHPWYVLTSLSASSQGQALKVALEETLSSAHELGNIHDAVVATSMEQGRALWRLRESIPEAERRDGASIKHDISVPISQIADFMAQAEASIQAEVARVRLVAFGHLGDGNIHFNLACPVGMDANKFLACGDDLNRVVNDIVSSFDGSISAEHGVGRSKRGEIRRHKSEIEMDIMERIKIAVDPNSLMNPGKVV